MGLYANFFQSVLAMSFIRASEKGATGVSAAESCSFNVSMICPALGRCENGMPLGKTLVMLRVIGSDSSLRRSVSLACSLARCLASIWTIDFLRHGRLEVGLSLHAAISSGERIGCQFVEPIDPVSPNATSYCL